jgi:drug/metabolite transporter (DMT)-like permease
MKKSYFLFPFVAILLWAGNVIVSKLSARTIDPSAITFYRLLLAVALMSLFTLKPAVLGFLAMALFQSLSYEAAKTTTATNMSIITALVPLMTMVASTLLLGEAPTTGMVGGGILSLAGVVYLITQGNPAMLLANGAHLGDLLMIFAALAYALYGVLLKRWHVGLPSWQSTYLQALFALLFMLPMLLRLPAAEAVPTRASVPLILYAGVLASVVLPFLWMQGVKHLGPNRCALFMNVLPIATALIAIAMLGETLHMYHVLGGGTALVGVIVAQMFKRPAAEAATARE